MYQQNVQKAQDFLAQNKDNIFKLYFDHLPSNPQRKMSTQAKLYALYNQPEEALKYLQQLNFDTSETIEPEEFEKNKIFDHIRENPSFKQWLNQYQQDYLDDQKREPKNCKSMQNI